MINCVPIKLINEMNKHYPNYIKQGAEYVELTRKDPNLVWDPICYAPINIGYYMTNFAPSDDMEVMALALRDTHNLIATLNWAQTKYVYLMDDELMNSLLRSNCSYDVPMAFLDSMPMNSFFVQFATPITDYLGVFYYFDAAQTYPTELRMTFIKENFDEGTMGFEIDHETVYEGIEKYLTGPLNPPQEVLDEFPEVTDRFMLNHFESDMLLGLKILLYICSQNADITPTEKKVVQKPLNQKPPTYKEVKEYDLGKNVGEVIRRSKEQVHYQYESKPGEKGTHKSPTPHIRRAHWHHFWTGERKGPDRKLILRWVAPMFIGEVGEQKVTIERLSDK